MSYNILVSHTELDIPIAKAISRVINNAFRGRIGFYLARQAIVGGADWKKELQENLRNSNALISIVTPDSIQKPWIYAEWSPFWLAGKNIYTLITEQIKISDLIQPMLDSQITTITNKDQVGLFFEALGKASNSDIPIPYTEINAFVVAIEQANLEKMENNYGIYRGSSGNLPDSDTEKKKIADYFYTIGLIDDFQRVVSAMRSDSLKTDIICDFLKDSKLEHQTELQVVASISKYINGADRLATIAIELINLGDLDAQELLDLIRMIHDRNQAELRNVAKHMASINKEDTDLFDYICSLLTNQAELRNVARHFVQIGKYNNDKLEELIEKIDAPAQLRHLALGFIDYGCQKSDQFKKVMGKLFSLPVGRDLKIVMEELLNHDRDTYTAILNDQSSNNEIVRQFQRDIS